MIENNQHALQSGKPNEAMSSKINNYENTNRLFDKAADLIGLDTDARLLLRPPSENSEVEVPLRLEMAVWKFS